MGSLLAQLANELGMEQDVLRTRILAADEALVPNYLQTQADGTTLAVFNGGIQINAVDVFHDPDRNSHAVRWVRRSDGALVAQIIGEEWTEGGLSPGNSEDMGIVCWHPNGGPAGPNYCYAGLTLVAPSPLFGGGQAQVFTGLASNGDFGDNFYIQLHQPTRRNYSSFVRGPSYLSRQRLIGGVIGGAAGNKIMGDGDWTTARTAAGTYTVTHEDFLDIQTGIGTAKTVGIGVSSTRTDATHTQFKTWDTNTKVLTDSDFGFIIYTGTP